MAASVSVTLSTLASDMTEGGEERERGSVDNFAVSFLVKAKRNGNTPFFHSLLLVGGGGSNCFDLSFSFRLGISTKYSH